MGLALKGLPLGDSCATEPVWAAVAGRRDGAGGGTGRGSPRRTEEVHRGGGGTGRGAASGEDGAREEVRTGEEV